MIFPIEHVINIGDVIVFINSKDGKLQSITVTKELVELIIKSVK